MTTRNILVLCTGNSCRSQMAEAYLRHFAPKSSHIYSAGIETHGLNPRAVAVMSEDGIDIRHHESKHVDSLSTISFDIVLTVCDHAHENCPIFPGHAKRIHHNFPDPARATGTEEEIMDAFRAVRNAIKDYAKAFTDEHLQV